MNPETAGTEEQGPSGVPFINDPEKPASRRQVDEQEREDDDIVDDPEP
ncbi:hypothetical protein G7Z99_03035 [Pseudomonas entomophila]|nr:hypothetical protein [Pseudomonas entomophila]MBA1188013.1 hypothetical protein [Pseudomonas entomophila]